MRRIPLVRLLLAHVTGPDLRRVSDPDLVSQVFHQLDEPLAVARGLHPDQNRLRQLLIKQLGVARSMHQFPLPAIPGLGLHPTHLLPAGMEITSYNHHRRLLSSQRLRPQTKTTGSESSLHSYPINSCVSRKDRAEAADGESGGLSFSRLRIPES